MFVSFLNPYEFRGAKARHLVVFYKQLQSMGREDMVFVAPREYFRAPALLSGELRGEWHADNRRFYEFEPPEDLDGVRHVDLPDDLLLPALGRLRAPLRVFQHLHRRRIPELEAAVAESLDSLASAHALEGVLTFQNMPSVDHVARLRGLPVIHNEVGPFRKPAWAMTAYWDLRGVNARTDAERRFRAFRRELRNRRDSLLSRNELLHMLRNSPLPNVPPASEAPFRVGVALQGEEHSFTHGFSALDLVTLARNRFGPREILIRNNPHGFSRYSDAFGVLDESKDATEFCLQCETVLTVNSGTVLEALLLGRRAVVLADSPFGIVAARALDAAPPLSSEADVLMALNFLALGYLVPYALIFDLPYIRWRLSGPSELDILQFHQAWYRTHHQPDTARQPEAAGRRALPYAVPLAESPAPTFVFGAGASTTALVPHLRSQGFALHGIFDNDPAKWGSAVDSLPVHRPAFQPDTCIIVASLTHGEAIRAQLQAMGYAPHRIVQLRPEAAA